MVDGCGPAVVQQSFRAAAVTLSPIPESMLPRGYRRRFCLGKMRWPVERHAGMTESGEARDKELDEKSDAEQHRHLKTNATADHRCGPVKHFYPGWNGNQHRRNGEEYIKWAAHPHGEHVMPPNAQT